VVLCGEVVSKETLLHKLIAVFFSLAALGAAHAQSAAPPDGMVAINYNRCDSNYDGWGAHLWKDGGGSVDGISWSSPMAPTGKSDFGVYWHTKLESFTKGNVNYIIHKGDTKEQGGKDMSFDGNASKQIWVINGDRKIYTSMEDAKKAREANPCK
jgi:hypothetical protein